MGRGLMMTLSVLVLSGCGARFSNLERTAGPEQTRADAVVVLGVHPSAEVHLVEGESDGWTWRRSASRSAAVVWPQDGFVVVKLAPRTGNQNYAVGAVMPPGFGASGFFADDGRRVLTFEAPPGQVTFVGALSLQVERGAPEVAIDDDVTVARVERFMAEAYPSLAGPPGRTRLRALRVTKGFDSEVARSDGVFSGMALGFWGGPSVLRASAADRALAGSGHEFALSLGISLWDHLQIGVSGGLVTLDDRMPFSEVVRECTEIGGATTCGGSFTAHSDLFARTGSLEVGYQYRFRPARSLSLLPALLAGYAFSLGDLSREIVGCDDCPRFAVHGVDLVGAYLAPSVRLIFAGGFMSLAIRTDLVRTDDLGRRTLIGLELFSL